MKRSDIYQVFVFFILSLFVFSCSSCAHLTNNKFLTNQKRSSIAFLASKTFINITLKKPTSVDKVEIFSKVFSSSGSSSIVKHNEKTSFVLTAAHICRIMYEQQIPKMFPFFNPEKHKFFWYNESQIYDIAGETFAAIPLVWNKSFDICIMVTPRLQPPALELSLLPSFPGERVYYMGFPRGIGGGKFVPIFEGFFLGEKRSFMDKNIWMYGYSFPIAPGSSGSAVLNSEGDLVGMIHSYQPKFDNIGYGATHKQIKTTLKIADEIYKNEKKTFHKELNLE